MPFFEFTVNFGRHSECLADHLFVRERLEPLRAKVQRVVRRHAVAMRRRLKAFAMNRRQGADAQRARAGSARRPRDL